MANGANRLFDVIKQTSEGTNGIASQVVSLTIKSVNPLILMRDDRLEIPAEFCILHKSLNINTFRINDIVTAIVLNNGQQYFILYNNTAEEQGINYNDLDNKPKINGVELKGNKTSDDLLIVSKSELQQVVAEMVDNINNKVTKSGDEMTGQLDMQSNPLRFGTTGNIFWKEDGYGNKFRVIPDFGNAGENNKLIIQSTTGEAGTDPQNWKDLVYIHADTGFIELAGRLLFNNKDSYDAIRKLRTINNTDYGVSIGVGANGSARMEYYTGSNTLSSIEARADGSLYNGVSGKKIIENNEVNFVHLGANSNRFSFSVGNYTGGFSTYIIYGGWAKHFMYLLTVHPYASTNVVGYNQIFNNTGEANINNVTMSNNVVTINFSSTIWGGIHIIGEKAQST